MTRRAAVALAAGAAGAGVATIGGLAQASTTPTLKTAANASLGKTIVVDGKGRTVYELSPEAIHHLLCISAQCLQFWPLVTVPSAHTKLTAAKGVPGKLGVLKRGKAFQVTLGGHPLYRFAGDGSAGQANGNGLKSFGGTWHVVKASAAASHTISTPVMSTPASTYTYPGP
jgi:predicted lipoprotein with Yx(FWY)xxD motif